jgi:hypothetical protein
MFKEGVNAKMVKDKVLYKIANVCYIKYLM